MADFLRLNYENRRRKQSEIANQFKKSSSTLQRYRNDTNMISAYRINPDNANKQTKRLPILILTTIHILILTLKDPI